MHIVLDLKGKVVIILANFEERRLILMIDGQSVHLLCYKFNKENMVKKIIFRHRRRKIRWRIDYFRKVNNKREKMFRGGKFK